MPIPSIFSRVLCRSFVGISLLALLLSLGACSWFQFPGVYRLSIPQGNIVTQEMVDQLKPGMTQRQVRFVLGTPLVLDSFNQNRWDYVYSLRSPNGDVNRKRFTVFFDGDSLSHFSGDYLPSSANALGTEATEAENDAAETDVLEDLDLENIGGDPND